MRRSILVTTAAALFSIAVTAVAEPAIDWPAAPSSRLVGAGQSGEGDIDWPAPPAGLTSTRGGEVGDIDWP
ncbi:hypothetical protein GTW37_11700 [Streptomyces sp. SID4931]|nr:hypothetical protein [Streptomyces sp. SID4931]SCF80812.1 hypothetical protein GA0115255_107184 [Streptomyces sp. Ncost-T6T-2b]